MHDSYAALHQTSLAILAKLEVIEDKQDRLLRLVVKISKALAADLGGDRQKIVALTADLATSAALLEQAVEANTPPPAPTP